MWRDRFREGQSGPSLSSAPPSRSISQSPAPRRSIQLGPSTALSRRPGLNPRNSSLSAASLNASAEDLPLSARLSNGSTLKLDLAGSSVANVADPLDVLADILGLLSKSHLVTANAGTARPVSLSGEIDFNGQTLEEFAIGHHHEPYDDATGTHDFELEKDKFEDLHTSITACDEVLRSVEMYLTSFQADLAAVSSEIENLQQRSTALNNKLLNRKAVEKVLGPEVEAVIIPPELVRKITEGAVDDAWVRALEELEQRSKAIKATQQSGSDVKAAQEILPLMDEVSVKAIERIRDYVVAQIKALRSPNINAQVIQHSSFLRYRAVFAFLATRQPMLAEEISQAYINTMRWYYTSHFMRYRAALEKLSLHAIDASDTIAADPAIKKSTARYDTFSIGRRGDALRTSNDTALPSYAAEDDQGTHHLEVPFRAFNLALVDNASAEYSFLTDFFPRQPFHATNRKFNEIFSSTFDLGQALTRQLTENCRDAIGILICVRLNQHFAFELQRRKVPSVEGYINATNMLLWPRFQQIIDAHCESIRKLTASLPGKPAGSALSLTSSPASAQTTAPHPLTQRFANFLQGILSLSSEAGDDEPISHSLSRLRGDFEAFLLKLSKGIAETRKRDRFLYNNYSLVCTIVADTEGKMAEELGSHFAELRDALSVDN